MLQYITEKMALTHGRLETKSADDDYGNGAYI